ncbi:glutathione S-transferase [Phaeobacter sp. B1627]|uniref:glutathione S-transferase n=1 Tax=Phaeobacter sp. B1627 TaxID=2583809 RepID=UPI00111B3127|nr:glutathione S-transferase [Phaeobacter sp. B1627]TNJ45101.1 glutathione S-transferase [Phaeobacter sp. B1627]
MKLFYSSSSPFVRKVMLVLHETDQLGAVELVQVATTVTSPDAALTASNPLGKIPALARDDGVTLYDSRVICAVLDDRAGGGLYAGGWDMKVLEATADGIMDAGVSMSYEKRLRPQEKQWDDWLEGQRRKILGACAAVEARWMPVLSGSVNIGQLAMAAALAYVDFRHPDAGWREGNPQLAAWFVDFESRPSMEATRPGAA